jgi:hypothetical protein
LKRSRTGDKQRAEGRELDDDKRDLGPAYWIALRKNYYKMAAKSQGIV